MPVIRKNPSCSLTQAHKWLYNVQKHFFKDMVMLCANNKNYITLISLALFWLTAILITSGCKEKSSQSPDVNNPPNRTQDSDAPEADEPVSVKKPERQTQALRTEPEVKLYLEDVIQSARSWGPSYISWYGKPAPDFSLPDLSGQINTLSEYRGKDVMLVFWALGCPPCRVEAPSLVKLRKEFPENELAILAVTPDSRNKLLGFVRDNNINYTILLQKKRMPEPFGVMRLYSTTGIPGSFFINPEGRIKIATTGLLHFEDMKNIVKGRWKNKR